MADMQSRTQEERSSEPFRGARSGRDGDADHARGAAHGIVRHHDSLDALRRSEERLRKIFEVGTVGLVIFDADGVVVDANHVFLEMIGYSREEMEAGKLSWRGLTPPQWIEISERELQKVAETGHIGPYEKEYTGKDGSSVWFLFTGVALDEGGVLEFVVDISERKKAEQALQRRERELSALNETLEARVHERTEQVRALANELALAEQEERDRIAQLLHDDLQQRLYAVQMQFDFLLQAHRDGDDETFRHDAQAIEEELQRIVYTTRRLSADLSPPVLHNHGLAEALTWLAEQMHEQFGLVIAVASSESFQVADDGLRVLLFQAVRELLFNVVKHAGASSASIRLQRQDGQVCIAVQDDGQGFDDAAVQAGARAGMGLSTLRHRLELVQGELQIQSQPGAGARVQIITPLRL